MIGGTKKSNNCFPDMANNSPKLPIKRVLKTLCVPTFSLKRASNSQGPDAQTIGFILKLLERNTIALVFEHGKKMLPSVDNVPSYEYASKIFCCS